MEIKCKPTSAAAIGVALPSLVGMVGGLICSATLAGAQNVSLPNAGRLEPIVVTAKRHSDPVADEKMKTQVEEALHSDPFFYDEHVTVTVENGVATLRGMVFDDWDMRQAMRISRRIAGVKRVVNDLEMVQRSSD
jgi:BON domain-containing protein